MNPMDMNPFTLSILISLANSLGVAWIAWTQYMRKPGEDASKGVDDLRERVMRVELRVEGAVTHQEISTLQGAMNEISARIRNIENHLIGRGL